MMHKRFYEVHLRDDIPCITITGDVWRKEYGLSIGSDLLSVELNGSLAVLKDPYNLQDLHLNEQELTTLQFYTLQYLDGEPTLTIPLVVDEQFVFEEGILAHLFPHRNIIHLTVLPDFKAYQFMREAGLDTGYIVA